MGCRSRLAYCADGLNDDNRLAGVICRRGTRSHAAVSHQARRVTGHAEREKIIMRISPEVAERVKEAPAQALRAVFSGIGQVLLVADRIKNRGTEPERAEAAAAATSTGPGRGHAAAKEDTRWRSLDETGNVRLLSEEDAPAAETPAAAESPAAAKPAAKPPAAAKSPAAAKPPAAAESAGAAESPAAEPPAAEPTVAEPGAPEQAALPVPNYDGLSLASLRARLRNLDQSQVRVLLDYEKAHAGRPDVLTMFERRIAKLDSGGA
jgi:hypothetical protein